MSRGDVGYRNATRDEDHVTLRILNAAYQCIALENCLMRGDRPYTDPADVCDEPWALFLGSMTRQASEAIRLTFMAHSSGAFAGTAALAALRRVILESRMMAAWLIEPTDPKERNARAGRILVRSIQPFTSSTSEYDDERREILRKYAKSMLEDSPEFLEVDPTRGMPNLRQIAEACGNVDLYDEYNGCSMDAHAGLGWTVISPSSGGSFKYPMYQLQRATQDLHHLLVMNTEYLMGAAKEAHIALCDTLAKEYVVPASESLLDLQMGHASVPEGLRGGALSEYAPTPESQKSGHWSAALACEAYLFDWNGSRCLSLRVRNASGSDATIERAEAFIRNEDQALGIFEGPVVLEPNRWAYLTFELGAAFTDIGWVPANTGTGLTALMHPDGPHQTYRVDNIAIMRARMHVRTQDRTRILDNVMVLH